MTDPKALIDRLLSETADTWDVMAANAEPPARRETLRECADLVRMLLSVGKSAIDTSLQPERAPTHRCTICGAFWMRWVAGWSLCSKQCGKCCDNAPMGEQIVPLIVSDIFGPADLITRLTTQLAEAEAEVGRLRAELDGIPASIPDDLAQHLVMLGEAEWGETDPKDAEGHAASVAKSIRKTSEHFGQTGDQPMQGLWIKGEPVLLCHTGTGPNSAQTARCLTAAWNFMLHEARTRQALASEPKS